jgi:hypothetical protein
MQVAHRAAASFGPALLLSGVRALLLSGFMQRSVGI